MPSDQDIVDALALLTPHEVTSLRKIRVGREDGDGGYVLADDFRPGQKVYSYGISNEVSFDLDLAERGMALFMYDHTIPGVVEQHDNFHFFKEGVAAQNDADASLFTVAHHVAKNGHDDDDMILKMDVEGAEWSVFEAMEPDLLRRFTQIALELHGLARLDRQDYLERFCWVMRKLTGGHNIIHVHANNAGGIRNVRGLPVPGLLEVTLLRKDRAEVGPWQSFVPTALDAPNGARTSRPDIVLSFFPFLPCGLSGDEMKSGIEAATRQANRALAKRYVSGTLDDEQRSKETRQQVIKSAQVIHRRHPHLKDDDETTARHIMRRLEDHAGVLELNKKMVMALLTKARRRGVL